MRFLEKLQVIERVDGLIRRRATGSAHELSNKLGVSRRTVYELINVMKNMGAPIEYCKQKKSFFYSYECDLAIGFVHSSKLKGGKYSTFQYNFLQRAIFSHNS